jgi:hypothetical protein
MTAETPQVHDDAQREMERRALRNVRGLVDKLEDEDRARRRSTLRFAAVSIAVALGLGAFVYWTIVSGKQAGREIVIEPVNPARR